MTRRELLTRMSGPELALQMAYDAWLADELDPDRPPTTEELGAKLRGMLGGGRQHGEVWQERRE